MPKKKVVVFGSGIIGSEAARQYPRHGYELLATVSSRALTHADGKVVPFEKRGNPEEILSHVYPLCLGEGVDLLAYALPSAGVNAAENELALMMPFLKAGKKAVLAGKAALAKYYHLFKPYLHQMGIDATVGGATMMLDEMERHLNVGNGEDILLELVINGTLSYIMTNVWAGRPLEVVIREAVHLKFAEPGLNNRTPDPLDVFKGEVEGDIPKKLAIILQHIFGEFIGRHLKPEDLKQRDFDEESMLRFTEGNVRRKYICRISTRRLPPSLVEVNSAGSIWTSIADKVFIQAGFSHIPVGCAFDTWVPNCGPGNAARIVQGGRERIIVADGAGDLATVGTMMKNSRKLCPPKTLAIRVPAQGARVDAELLR